MFPAKDDTASDRLVGESSGVPAIDRAFVPQSTPNFDLDITNAPDGKALGPMLEAGEIDALLPPVQAAGQEPVMGPVPAFGAHTEAIRAEFGTDSR